MIKKFKLKVLRFLQKELSEINTISNTAKLDSSVLVKGSQLGSNVVIGANSKIKSSRISSNTWVGDNSLIQESTLNGSITINEGCRLFSCQINGTITLGKYTSLWGPHLQIVGGKQQVNIGSFCSIARNVYMQTYNHNHKKVSTYYLGQNVFKEKWENEKVSSGDITIKNDVWVGANVTILGGVTIGNGALVAANSVLTKDVPPFAIVAGIPAKVIKYRFDKPTIEIIQKLAWWDWPMDKILKNKWLFEEELANDYFDLSKIIQ